MLKGKRSRARATSYIPNFVFGLAVIARIGMAADDAQKYTGPGSCSSPACHGGVTERKETTVLQNEYSTWVVRDKHAHAYTELTNSVGTRMAKILGLHKPDTEPKCLACHALDVPEGLRARTFDITEGVSCENCHGPASAWLGPHTTRDWKHEKSIELGMYPTRDPVKRSEKCLSCHLGTPGKFVDHEMIAAGHPDLYFEMDSFASLMPAHWKEEDAGIRVLNLAVGQAVQLREQLKRVARAAQGGIWPEYAELECFSCHHSLTAAKDSWRQERGYPGRRPGNPPLNLARFVVFRRIVHEVDPGGAQQLESEMRRVYSLVTALNSDRRQVASQAGGAAETAERIAQNLAKMQLDKMPFNQDKIRSLMKSISGDADSITEQGERAAEQATMVLASLAVAGHLDKEPRIKAVIHTLFELVKDPSAFNGARFAGEMKSLHSLLP